MAEKGVEEQVLAMERLLIFSYSLESLLFSYLRPAFANAVANWILLCNYNFSFRVQERCNTSSISGLPTKVINSRLLIYKNL